MSDHNIAQELMTPAERAIAANHPSTYKFSDTDLRRQSSDAGESAAADSPAFSDFHATVTDINDAADRLRVLLRRGSPDDAVEAHRDLSRGATSPGVQS